jgi:Leucine-rich repeat (LRR) protein
MDKKYQVFISSTYLDLIDERKAVLEAILGLGHMPSGMELFPAANDNQWDLIKKVIDDCDYYIVIIGGKYGSLASEGISYTEKEYDYAIEQGKPVLGFIFKDVKKLKVEKFDLDEDKRVKLEEFKNKVKQRMVNFYENPKDLKSNVVLSLNSEMQKKEAIGWIRADQIISEDITLELLQLRKENEELKKKLHSAEFEKPEGTDKLKQGNDEIDIDITFKVQEKRSSQLIKYNSTTSVTINEIYKVISPFLNTESTEKVLQENISMVLYEKLYKKEKNSDQFKDSKWIGSFQIQIKSFNIIMVQLDALGLIKKSERDHGKVDKGKYWTLTTYGNKKMKQLLAIEKDYVRFERLGLEKFEYKFIIDFQNNYETTFKHESSFPFSENSFVVEGNHITKLNIANGFVDLVDLKRFQKLIRLNLRNIRIGSDIIPSFNNLNQLTCRSCTCIEGNFEDLFKKSFRNLNFLGLSEQDLTEIPIYLKNLKKLETLYFRKNNIKEIPQWISEFSELKELTTLSLLDNKIEFIPYFSKEIYLDLMNNPIKDISDKCMESTVLFDLDLTDDENFRISDKLKTKIEVLKTKGWKICTSDEDE